MPRYGWLLLFLLIGVGAFGADKAWEKPGKEAGEEITGPDGMPMVWVPAGEFIMGCTEKCHLYSQPPHRVRLSGFWLHKYEVTNAQFRAFCMATGHPFPQDSRQPDSHPVCAIMWKEAKAYADYYGLRLPTEAEWEYAGRGPEGRLFPWGGVMARDDFCCWFMHRDENPGRNTFPVGSHHMDRSWCGAFDMAGNISEFCLDVWEAHYYEHSPAQNPMGPPPTFAEREGRVVRGGNWHVANEDGLKLCGRTFWRWDLPHPYAGFRCAFRPQ